MKKDKEVLQFVKEFESTSIWKNQIKTVYEEMLGILKNFMNIFANDVEASPVNIRNKRTN